MNAIPHTKIVLDAILEVLADKIAERLSERPASALPLIYTSSKRGPHFPGKSRRWTKEKIRHMPGARKVGRDWEITSTDYEAWKAEQDAAHVRSEVKPRPLRRAELALDDAELAARAAKSLRAAGFRRSK